MIVDASENWWYQYHQPGGLGHRLREQGYCSHKISDNVSMLVIFNKYYLYHELSHHMTNFSIISPTQVHARFRYWRTRFRFFWRNRTQNTQQLSQSRWCHLMRRSKVSSSEKMIKYGFWHFISYFYSFSLLVGRLCQGLDQKRLQIEDFNEIKDSCMTICMIKHMHVMAIWFFE